MFLTIKQLISFPILLIGVAGTLMSINSPAIASNCQALSVVGGSGTQVTKKVSPPATFYTKNDWNTDFSVPGGARFSSYVVRISSQDDAAYPMKGFLKYSDNTNDNFLNETVSLTAGGTKSFTATPRPVEPYQVNVLIGSLESLGKTYTLAVEGCYPYPRNQKR
ncbi:MAG: hypothetical protein WCA35_12065 [Kovacikia sp.]